MTDTANERIVVGASADRCWDVAVDFESYPEWVRDVKEARILERDAEGRGHRVEFRAAALGKSLRYVLEYDYSDAPNSFSWKFVEGDMLRRLDGTLELFDRACGALHSRICRALSRPLVVGGRDELADTTLAFFHQDGGGAGRI